LTLAAVASLASLTALGGCGDDEPDSDLDRYYARCAMPRTGESPLTGDAYPDEKGSLDDEKRFLRAWIDELYLWYREVPDVAPADLTPVEYFDKLKTPEKTASGKDKDAFHFVYDSEVWEQLSQAGVSGGYGATWSLISASPPRRIVVAYTEPGSEAERLGLRRGAEVITVDGVDVATGTDLATLNGGLFPDELGVAHTFVLRDYGAADTRTVTMTAASVTSVPVQNVKVIETPLGNLGYLAFHDHIAPAEAQLANAINTFRTAEIEDLVLDLRYNGGGYLALASELSYMLAGPAATAGKAFEQLRFNDRHTETDPFTGAPLGPEPFRTRAVGFSLAAGTELPALALRRVFVLTGAGTCSASESVMNALRGIDVEVIQIGTTTCGKPYGFYPQDNCGTTYFAIQFQGVNQKGFGDYADGFVPGGAGPSGVPGCVVPDDFSRELGDPLEARLATVIGYRVANKCPERPAATATARPLSAIEGQVMKPMPLRNRIMGLPGAARR
jgi:carboxyl-terminal processing protease